MSREYDDEIDDCDHEDYELDILTGRASCTMCEHCWFMSEAELLRDIRRRGRPYNPDSQEKA